MIKYDSAVNQFPTAYWDSIRPVPLNAEEINDYKVKDSMFNLAEQRKKMPGYMDSLRKQQGKIKWLSLPFSGLKRTHYGKHESYRWGIEPLLMNTNYNSVEGVNTELKMSFEKYFSKSRMKLNVNPLIRYGFYNGHLNPSIQIGLKTRNRHKSINTGYHTWGLKFGREVVQFNELNPIQPLLNTWTTLFDGNNPMKIYERSLLSVTYKKHAEQGWDLTGGVTWEDRNPLSNNTSFTIKKQDSIRLTPNVPKGRILPEDIYKHQLFALSLGFSFQPGQKFIQFPKNKVSMGSDYPVFSVNFKKAIPGVWGADADFEKWDLIVTDEFSLRMLGAINYKVETGGFTRRKKLLFQDYKHFNANTVGGLGLSVNGFKLMDNYINSNNAQFYAEAHIDHHFKGLLTNKIPGLRKWKWDLVTGVNTYWINSKDYYYEFSVGIENILKIFRLDYVFAYQNGTFQRSAFVLGAGGLLGNGLGNNAQSNSSSVSIGF
jgi:hypothetical protein